MDNKDLNNEEANVLIDIKTSLDQLLNDCQSYLELIKQINNKKIKRAALDILNDAFLNTIQSLKKIHELLELRISRLKKVISDLNKS